MKVKLEDLKVEKNFSRGDSLGNLDELRESMRTHGQLVPVVVAQDGVTLVAGFRRAEVARQLGWESIDAVTSTVAPGVANLIENLVREDLTLWDEMQGIREVFGPDPSCSEVQRALGKSRTWVKLRVDAWKLPKEKLDQIRMGLLSVSAVSGMLKEKRGPSAYQKNTGCPSHTEISRTITELMRRGKQAEARALSYALGTLSREELLQGD